VQRAVSPCGWAFRLSEVLDAGVVVLGQDRRIDFANRRARRLLDVGSDTELEQAWIRIQPELAPLFDRAVPGASSPVEGSVLTGPSPEAAALRIQMYVIDEDEYSGHLLLLQNADRADAIDASLRHATRNRNLGPLYRDHAHDLKGAMNVIAMNVELLARRNDGDSSQSDMTVRSAVVRRELNRLDRTLDVVLNSHPVERESPQVYDLGLLCRSLFELVAPRASRQHVRLDLAIQYGRLDLDGFPDRIHDALLNLLVNSLDAMTEGGTLKVTVERSTAARVYVCHTGPGLEDDKVSELWCLHDSSRARGTGVGLYVTRMIVEAHGGRISYGPGPSGDSCFIVELPAPQPHSDL